MDNTIEIPIRNSEEVIELECSNLPEPDEVLQILIQEKAQMKIWIRLALEYWRQDRKSEFQQILEAARNDAGVDYIGQDKARGLSIFEFPVKIETESYSTYLALQMGWSLSGCDFFKISYFLGRIPMEHNE